MSVQSPTAWKTKGDDYNRNPVGTGPYVLKSWTAGDRLVLEKNPDYWNKGQSLSRPHRAEAAAGCAVALRQPAIRRSRYHLGRRIRRRQHPEGAEGSEAEGPHLCRAPAPRSTPSTPRSRRSTTSAFARRWSWRSIARRCRRRSPTASARPATNPYGDGSWVKCKDDGALPYDVEKAKALIKDYGKPVEFKMIVTATPRGRNVGQVLQQFWKQVGANMEIEQVDQATIVPRAFMRQFQLTPWRIVDLADPDVQMYANFRTGSPVALANYSNPELDRLLRPRAGRRRTRPSGPRTIARSAGIINKEAIWFWTFQNTYYAISTAKLKGLPKIYHGVIDVSRCLAGIAAHAGLCRAKAPVPGAGPDRRLAADLPDRVAAAGRSRLRDPRRPGDAGEGRGVAP